MVPFLVAEEHSKDLFSFEFFGLLENAGILHAELLIL